MNRIKGLILNSQINSGIDLTSENTRAILNKFLNKISVINPTLDKFLELPQLTCSVYNKANNIKYIMEKGNSLINSILNSDNCKEVLCDAILLSLHTSKLYYKDIIPLTIVIS